MSTFVVAAQHEERVRIEHLEGPQVQHTLHTPTDRHTDTRPLIYTLAHTQTHGQTYRHSVDTCPLTKFEGGMNLLHEADDDAVFSDACSVLYFTFSTIAKLCLQCFDAVGWVAGRASGL